MISSLDSISSQFPGVEVEYEDMLAWPYMVDGRGASGINCFGVVLEIFRRAGLGLPDPLTSPAGIEDFADLFEPVTDPGTLYDICYISKHSDPGHMAILVRPGRAISARSKAKVYTVALNALRAINGAEFYRVRSDRLPG